MGQSRRQLYKIAEWKPAIWAQITVKLKADKCLCSSLQFMWLWVLYRQYRILYFMTNEKYTAVEVSIKVIVSRALSTSSVFFFFLHFNNCNGSNHKKSARNYNSCCQAVRRHFHEVHKLIKLNWLLATGCIRTLTPDSPASTRVCRLHACWMQHAWSLHVDCKIRPVWR